MFLQYGSILRSSELHVYTLGHVPIRTYARLTLDAFFKIER